MLSLPWARRRELNARLLPYRTVARYRRRFLTRYGTSYAVLGYIERNPVRAGLVERIQVWPSSSAAPREADEPTLDPGPVPRSRKGLTTPTSHRRKQTWSGCATAFGAAVRLGIPLGCGRPPANLARSQASVRAVARPNDRLTSYPFSTTRPATIKLQCPLFPPSPITTPATASSPEKSGPAS
jgi:hypothetical protein